MIDYIGMAGVVLGMGLVGAVIVYVGWLVARG